MGNAEYMGTHPIFESDFDCLTERKQNTKMPSKIQEVDAFDGDEEMMPEMMPEMPERKEYLWSCDLEGENAQFKFEGGDSETEMLTFKSAALGEGASGKHVVKVSAVGANSEKVTAILCVLSDQNCWVRLGDLAVEPPLLLSLAEGSGPVNICANHLLEEDPEMDDEEDEEADSEEMVVPEVVEAEVTAKKQPAKSEPKKEEKKRKAEDTEKESPANKKAKAEKKEKRTRSYETIEDVKKAIIANPGGKPKKEEKFGNWVKNTMKCTNEDWIKDLWTWHKEEHKL